MIERKGQLWVDSRDVAEMTGKRHDHLMRDIDGYKAIMEQTPNLGAASFFQESSYKAGAGKNYRCYLLTKKGCEMVANKLTGTKGIKFTAVYVNEFEEMKNQLKTKAAHETPQTLPDALRMAADAIEEKQKLQIENAEMEPKASYFDKVMQSESLLTVSQIAKDYGMSARQLNSILNELGVQYKQNGCWLLYAKYQDKGYTQTKTEIIYGQVVLYTNWTQEGRWFIYNLLKQEKHLVPLMEREIEFV
ncbi:Rha family transcriptional regulator [Shouchella lonarensis]|uniref:Rha family transcriptional regulator n=1 Tax=Shouchella lonarensis TaxID=1464122 RepID=UPI001FDFF146|nr:phage regulatory protein/antirepressor Ant [Shouchella lonarensis]